MADDQSLGNRAEGPSEAAEPVALGDKYLILPDRRIPDLATKNAQAFEARDRISPKMTLYALVCVGDVPAREPPLERFTGRSISGYVQPRGWGVVKWPASTRPRTALILPRPHGVKVMASLDAKIRPFHEKALKIHVIEPILETMRKFANTGVTHRGIRPTNLFYRQGEEGPVMLGECVSAPPAYDQPAVLEPVESGMSHPAGRGPGAIADDIYALGVTLLALSIGRVPHAELSDDEVTVLKLERGSYNALAAGRGLASMIEGLVRGTLVDDARKRWTLSDIEAWLTEGRIHRIQDPPPRPTDNPVRVGRAFCSHPRVCALTLTRDHDGAVEAIKSGAVEAWSRRAVKDTRLADRVAEIAKGRQPTGAVASPNGDALMVARVAMALDPPAPLRYKGVSATVDGLGPLLSMSLMRGENAQILAEIIDGELPVHWLAEQEPQDPRLASLAQGFKQLGAYLRDSAHGYGIDRCLYEFNPGHPCLSPILRDRHITKIGDLLPALEEVMSGVEPPAQPVDRHIAAFLGARLRGDVKAALEAMASRNDPKASVIGMLMLLARLQETAGPASTPVLTAWFARRLDMVIEEFQSRPMRLYLRARIEKLAGLGSLRQLLGLANNRDLRWHDREGYAAARAEHARISAECQRIEQTVVQRRRLAERTGRQIAAALSGLFAAVTVAGVMLFQL